MRSPFVYGNTVTASAFTNREEETNKLHNNLVGGINTMLISPRRWGKSSLVEKVLQDIRESDKQVRIVSIDMFSVRTEQEFLELFAKEVIKASHKKWQKWVDGIRSFFKQVIPKISFGMDPQADFSLSFDWETLKKSKAEVLNLAEVIAEQKDLRYIICIDEFQDVSNFHEYENLEKLMRSVWQRQQRCTYCFYGSKRHMMAEIFDNPSKPFYRFGDIIHLGKIKRERWVDFIIKSFEETNKKIEAHTAEIIPQLMMDHSWYVQQLAHYTWNRTTRKAKKKDIISAMRELMAANSPMYEKEYEGLSKTQINLLKAIACGETKLTAKRVMDDYKLGTPNNVSKNKRVLIKLDIVDEAGGEYDFLDPAFHRWFHAVILHNPLPIEIE